MSVRRELTLECSENSRSLQYKKTPDSNESGVFLYQKFLLSFRRKEKSHKVTR